jgi:hypothetical protein
MMIGPSGRIRGVALCLCVLLTAGSCRNVETIQHGRQMTKEGALSVVSLQPQCGCVSLRNKSQKRIGLESTFYGIKRGDALLDPGERMRVMFDWAGDENGDYYLVNAYDVDADGKPNKSSALRMQDVVEEYAPFVGTSCGDQSCAFNGLAMNRMMDDTEELERETATRGINFTSVIEASAPQNECGCMLVSNNSEFDLTLRATLHGSETGQMELKSKSTMPLVFDWAGPLDTDVYAIEAVDVRSPDDPTAATKGPGQAGIPNSPNQRAGSAMTIRLKDYVSLSGTLVDMACGPVYAEFLNKRRQSGVPQTAVRCAWKPDGESGLGMRLAYDKKMKQTSTNASPSSPTAAAAPKQ